MIYQVLFQMCFIFCERCFGELYCFYYWLCLNFYCVVEVQIKIDSVGICGTDVHFWQDGGMGDFTVKEPVVLGHEPAGTVTKLGPGVKSLQVG